MRAVRLNQKGQNQNNVLKGVEMSRRAAADCRVGRQLSEILSMKDSFHPTHSNSNASSS